MVSKDDLTKPIVVTTVVPSPPPPKNEDGTSAPGSDTAKIELTACSEFLEYASAIKYFNSGSKLLTLQDFAGQPMVFAIGQNNMLNCLVDEPGKATGWKMYTVSPPNKTTVAFDAFKVEDHDDSSKSGLFLTVATSDADGLTTVHHAWLKATIPTNEDDLTPNLDFQAISWKVIPDVGGRKAVSTLSIGMSPSKQLTKSPYIIFAGTKIANNKAATFYIIDPSPNVANPWTTYSPDTDEDVIQDIQPATLGTAVEGGIASNLRNGVFVLSTKRSANDCLFYALDSKTMKKDFSLSILRPQNLGKINAIASSRNPWGLTDLVLACEKGIAFVDHQKLKDKPLIVQGLPETEFRQVVCSELVNPSNPDATAITIFAISRQNELYFIEGKREWATGTITFRASGLPIRRDVARISCQFNAKLDSSELVYAGTGDAQVMHMLRDPITGCWTETVLNFSAPKAITRYNAFITSLSFRSTDGRSLIDFDIGVSAEPTSVLVNDRSYTLGRMSTKISTNSSGQIVIVAAARDGLAAPSYTFEVFNAGVSHSETIYAGQRIRNILSRIKDDKGVLNARSTAGAPVFSKSDVAGKEADFQEAAQFLMEFPSMLDGVEKKSNGNDIIEEGDGIVLSSGPETQVSIKAVRKSSIGDDISEFFGDAAEWLRDKAKGAFKAWYKVLAKGLRFVVRIAGKVLHFVLKTVGPLVRTVCAFLKDKLGIDLGKMLDWLGLTFDNSKTKANQELLKASINQMIMLPRTFLQANASGLDRMFRDMKSNLQPVINSHIEPGVDVKVDANASARNSPLGLIFDNPIMNTIAKLNPVTIIMESYGEAMAEVFAEDIEIPAFGQLKSRSSKILNDIVEGGVDKFGEILDKIWDRIKNVLQDPSKLIENLIAAFQDIAHTLFDAVESAVKGVWMILSEIIDLTITFINGKWVIPLVTDFFEFIAEQDFTLLNAVTFVVCRVLGLIVGEDKVSEYLDFANFGKELNDTLRTTDVFGILFGGTTTTAAVMADNTNDEKALFAVGDDDQITQEKKDKYRRFAKCLTSINGIARYFIVAPKGFATREKQLLEKDPVLKSGDAKFKDRNSGIARVNQTLALTATSILTVCNVGQLAVYCGYFKEFGDPEAAFRFAGHGTAIISSFAGASIACYDFFTGKSPLSIKYAVTTCVTTSIVSSVAFVHLVPEVKTKNITPADLSGDILALLAAGAGVGTFIGGIKNNPKLQYGCLLADAGCTLGNIGAAIAIIVDPKR